MKNIVIHTKNLTKQYGDLIAVDGLELSIRKGEAFGVLGPNGAGKTTTIQMLTGLLAPTSGEITVFGLDPVSSSQRVRASIGYAMQQSVADTYLTARENMLMYAQLYNLSHEEARIRVDELLEWAGLTDAADRLVSQYSGGMMRRLDLSICLLHRPQLLLLDEPTVGLDVVNRRQLWALVKRLKAAGTTIVLTTHYLEEANELCDRVALINKGRLVGLGTPDSVKARFLGDAHQLAVAFRQPPNLDSVDLRDFSLTTAYEIDGTDLLLSGPPRELWAAFSILQQQWGDEIQSVDYKQPTLDDVFVKISNSETV
ncbi:MAG: ATP-binding cassette domain-containing protein [Chloroflexota bacterium]